MKQNLQGILKIIPIAILLPFLLHCTSFSQTSDNAELEKMYRSDQGARSVPNIDWLKLAKEDEIREKRVYEILKSEKVITGKDYYHSAMIFQHGRDSTAYSMAVKLMKKAIELDSTVNRWLLAAAIDRELMSKNKPQIYGTQFTKNNDPDAKWELYQIDSTQITDEERKYYNVEPLSKQRNKARYMNLLTLIEYHLTSGSIENTIVLIKKEKAKGSKSLFNVSESGINKLGYELMKSKKKEDALKIFKLNTILYPAGANAFDSLGECLLLLGRKEDAIKAYKRSLELNPNNENASKILNDQK